MVPTDQYKLFVSHLLFSNMASIYLVFINTVFKGWHSKIIVSTYSADRKEPFMIFIQKEGRLYYHVCALAKISHCGLKSKAW